MIKNFIEYNYSFQDDIDFSQYLSDSTLTKNDNLATLADNQYNYSSTHDVTFQSDGTKRVGFYIDLDAKIMLGDRIEADMEIQSHSGSLPVVVYEEYNTAKSAFTKSSIKTIQNIGGYEYLKYTSPIYNRYGTYGGRLFVGLEIGQSGRFSFRFPLIKHYAQKVYKNSLSVRSQSRVFQLSKTAGTWAIDASAFYRKLDAGTLSVGSTSIYLNFAKPFVQEVPHVTGLVTNKNFAGKSVNFGYRAKDQIELAVYDAAGTALTWASIPDGSIIIIKLEVGLYN